MDRYKIHDIKYYDVGANLFLGQNGQIVRNQIVPLDFVYGLRPGDVVRGLGRRDLMSYHTAFSCRGRLYLVLEPMGDGYDIETMCHDFLMRVTEFILDMRWRGI